VRITFAAGALLLAMAAGCSGGPKAAAKRAELDDRLGLVAAPVAPAPAAEPPDRPGTQQRESDAPDAPTHDGRDRSEAP
jgi:hypothetical protein